VAEPRPPNHLAVLEGNASVRVRTRIERTLEAAAPPPRLYGKPLQGDGDFPGPPSPFQPPTAYAEGAAGVLAGLGLLTRKKRG
jgi:hypothetical protein